MFPKTSIPQEHILWATTLTNDQEQQQNSFKSGEKIPL